MSVLRFANSITASADKGVSLANKIRSASSMALSLL
jgi:hypothetical protein